MPTQYFKPCIALNKFDNLVQESDTLKEFFEQLCELYKNTKIKGDCFEYLTKSLFLLHPFYRNQTDKIYLLKDLPETERKKLNLPLTDKGIDLVWITKDGKKYAIQCKFRRDVDATITWTEVSTFVGLTFGIAKEFDGGIFVTNQSNMCAELESTDKIAKIYGTFWDSVPVDFMKQIKRLLVKQAPIHTKRQPKDYQKKIIDKIIAYFKGEEVVLEDIYDDDDDKEEFIDNRRRVTLIGAPGIGKSLIALWITQLLKAMKTLVVVPSLNLLSQFFLEWMKEIDDPSIKFLLIGSDVSQEIKEDHPGVILTVDPEEIATWIKKNEKEKTVIITTYQSSHLLCKKKYEFDLCIFDEAHRTVGQSGTTFTHLLNDKNTKIEKRIFMTATPRVYNGNNDKVVSMKNKEVYGPVAVNFDIKQALALDVLTQYQVLHMYSSDKQIEKYIVQQKLVIDKKLIAELKNPMMLASAIMVLKAMRKYKYKHVVTYHTTIKQAKQFDQLLRMLIKTYNKASLSGVMIDYADGNDSMKIRSRKFGAFETAEKAILCTSRVLQEGVDKPIIDCVCFIDPKQSVVDIVQAIGRCLRKFTNKNMAYVMIPSLLTDDEESAKDAFRNVWAVVRSLATSDGDLKEFFRGNYTGKKEGTGVVKYKQVRAFKKIDLGLSIKVKEWLDSIKAKIWKGMDNFEARYDDLKKFVDEYKRMPTRESKDKMEASLSSWGNTQRGNFRKELLSIDKINKLNEIDGWYWVKDDIFEKRFEELQQFIDEFKRMPNANSENKEEESLYNWCKIQRKKFRKKKLTDDQINNLAEIKGWFWDRNIFEERLAELQKFVDEYKRMPTKNQNNNTEDSLSNWCKFQRKLYKTHKLSQYQITKLNKINQWYWDKPKPKTIQELYKIIKEWLKNRTDIPKNSNDQIEQTAYRASISLREKYNANKLSPKCIKKFKKIEQWYWDKEDILLNEFEKWVNDNKRLPIYNKKMNGNKQESRLACWAYTQRKRYAKNELTKKKIDRLNAIPLWHWIVNTK